MAELVDIVELVEHDLRHFREPAVDGQPAHPFPYDYPWNKQKMIEDKFRDWPKGLDEIQWGRSFLLMDQDQIVGHLNLKNIFEGSLHRAQLGMGIEVPYRGRGLGKQLITSALDWARDQTKLEWIDLSVFSYNLPARNLYASMGFEEICVLKDKIRVNGQSIDDILMTLKVVR